MDRRQQKTREAIFSAFSTLLKRKNYNNITVQEIIDEANIGRSTFYSHFETKDKLLKTMCSDIFDHIFDDDLKSEETHDFSNVESDLNTKIIHILYHIKDSRSDISSILASESGELFLRYFKDYLQNMFEKYLYKMNSNVPEDFLLNHLVGSMSETILWWIRNDMKETPEEIAGYYRELTYK